MEDVLAITFLFGGGSMFLLAISPVGRAIADRIRGGSRRSVGGEELERIRDSHLAVLDELYALRQEVGDLQERLDFAERMLLSGRGQERLEPGPAQNA